MIFETAIDKRYLLHCWFDIFEVISAKHLALNSNVVRLTIPCSWLVTRRHCNHLQTKP